MVGDHVIEMLGSPVWVGEVTEPRCPFPSPGLRRPGLGCRQRYRWGNRHRRIPTSRPSGAVILFPYVNGVTGQEGRSNCRRRTERRTEFGRFYHPSKRGILKPPRLPRITYHRHNCTFLRGTLGRGDHRYHHTGHAIACTPVLRYLSSHQSS